MLSCNLYEIGNKMLFYRKRRGMTQIEVAERAGISDRTYADIERGTVNMRIETFIRICNTLQISPNDVLMDRCSTGDSEEIDQDDLIQQLNMCDERHRKNAKRILNAFLSSVNEK